MERPTLKNRLHGGFKFFLKGKTFQEVFLTRNTENGGQKVESSMMRTKWSLCGCHLLLHRNSERVSL